MKRVCTVGLGLALVVQWATPAAAAWTGGIVTRQDRSAPATSLAISPNGAVAVSWQWQGGDELYWAERATDGWRKRAVYGSDTYGACYPTGRENPYQGPVAYFTPSGLPRIVSACFAVGGGAKFNLTSHESGSWSTTVIGYGPSEFGYDCSATNLDVALDPVRGRPSVVFSDQGTDDVSRLVLKKSGWVLQELVPGVHVPGFDDWKVVSAAYDPVTGNLGVVWNSDADGGGYLTFAEFGASGDMQGGDEDIPITYGAAYGVPSLAFAADGTAYVAFQQGTETDRELVLAIRTGASQWSSSVIDSGSALTGAAPSLALWESLPRVAYRDESRGNLRYAAFDGASWALKTIESTGRLGEHPSLALDGSGRAWISHYDRTNRDVRFATNA